MTDRRKQRRTVPGMAVRVALIAAVVAPLIGWGRSVAQEQVPDSFWLVLFPGSHPATAKSCASYLAALEGHPINVHNGIEHDGEMYWDESALYTQWIGGFISGMNLVEKMKTGKQVSTNWPDIEAWLKDYCDANPKDDVVVGLEKFYFAELLK